MLIGHFLTIDGLYASDVIIMQPEIGRVASVVRGHQCTAVLGVPQAQGVSNLMGRHYSQVGAGVLALRPSLILIKVDDT